MLSHLNSQNHFTLVLKFAQKQIIIKAVSRLSMITIPPLTLECVELVKFPSNLRCLQILTIAFGR